MKTCVAIALGSCCAHAAAEIAVVSDARSISTFVSVTLDGTLLSDGPHASQFMGLGGPYVDTVNAAVSLVIGDHYATATDETRIDSLTDSSHITGGSGGHTHFEGHGTTVSGTLNSLVLMDITFDLTEAADTRLISSYLGTGVYVRLYDSSNGLLFGTTGVYNKHFDAGTRLRLVANAPNKSLFTGGGFSFNFKLLPSPATLTPFLLAARRSRRAEAPR